MKLSIVIPVYNTSEYLKECLDSFIYETKQMKNQVEIILVNDGSSDNSLEICRKYDEEFNNVVVIDQVNQGQSYSRNIGLEISTGDYVMFVDSDDMIAGKKLLNLIETISNQDVIFLDTIKFYGDGTKEKLKEPYEKNEIYNKTQKEVLAHLAGFPRFPGSPWGKVIKSKLLKENKINFDIGFSAAEDIDWFLHVLEFAKLFDYYDEGEFYYYRQNREGSVTNNISEKHIKSLLEIIEEWEIKIEAYPIYGKFLAYEYIILLLNYDLVDKKIKNKYATRITRLYNLVFYQKKISYWIIGILVSFFGINFTSKLINVYQKIN